MRWLSPTRGLNRRSEQPDPAARPRGRSAEAPRRLDRRGGVPQNRRPMDAIVARTRRAEIGLLAVLGALAAGAWVVTAERMRGMDAGPNTDPGSLGVFLGVWVVMMAAMMLPSAAPMVAVYARLQRSRVAVALFAGGYLALWTAAGVAAYALAVAARRPSID